MESIIPLDLSPAGLQRDAFFLKEVMPHAAHITPDFLHWEYLENPAGPAIGFNVFDGNQQIAHSVLQPLTTWWNGSCVRGVLSLNSATHPKHRRKGLYFSLAQKSYARAFEMGFEFVIGVANQVSTPGFISKAGFQLVCPLDVRLGVGPIAYKKIREEARFEKIWDAPRLAWRLSCPTITYRLARHHNTTWVYGPARKLGVEIIMGNFPSEHLSSRPPSFFSLRNPIRLWAGLNQNIHWKKSAYFPLPMRFRPAPLNLIFKDLTGQNRSLDPHTVKWNAIDFDTF